MHSVARSVLCVFLLLFALPSLAQADAGTNPNTSTLIGTVRNAHQRRPIADVAVTASSPNLQGELRVSTDAQGSYRIPQLPPGDYTLTFEKEGFKPYTRSAIQLRLNRTRQVDVELLSASQEEPVRIIGAPPTIDVGSTTMGVNVDQEFIKRIAVARPGGKGGASRSYEPPDAMRNPHSVSLNGPSVSTLPSQPLGRPGLPKPPSAPRRVISAVEPSEPTKPPAPAVTPAPVSPFHMYFQGYGVNPTVTTEEERFSTFSVDTDSASYTLTRAYLERGSLPNEQAVRVEEFVNTFDYGYAHQGSAPFSVQVEGFPSPVRKGYHVVHVGVKAWEVPRVERKPSHLVFVIDVSGSMNLESRLGLVKRSLHLLVNELDERDQVSIVVYGSTARLVLEPTSAVHPHIIRAAIDSLYPEGSTNAQAGLEMGYSLAASHLVEGGINRVILCSDGVANTGLTDADSIWQRIRARAAKGITLSTVGFGMGNYNDVLMERLSQVGEGHYAYVDRIEEAHRIFVRDLTGTLQVVAKDVKLQMEFNPEAVSHYRLLGYENRMLTKEQFADDRVDAGEIGAGHAVTALYEVKLTEPSASFGTLRIRYKAPEGGDSQLIEKPLPSSVIRPAYGRATPPTRLSYVAAAFAEKLRGSYWVRPLSYDALFSLWEEIGQPLKGREDVMGLGTLIQKARTLDRRADRFEAFAPVSTMDFDRVPTLP
ncbi:VWA domain-containing protein [Myxococcus xanthus]|uniref:VWA domain-containing protein n=1 Tax=Myxococcus xanthus TaxID=34 RepID=A0AAE6KW42_MYXXA|nr:von Willebrand factor type A domain-containing protein [Myxococcus xanthus]QDE72158.1 VWA domain-containing protein [Myxococcus xanthus]QDE79440.1 VWA domain-containing protein [Myxococcus xanthus]